MAISMLKIRRPLGRLIFNMGIAIAGKTVFLIETAPRLPKIILLFTKMTFHHFNDKYFPKYKYMLYIIQFSFSFEITFEQNIDCTVYLWKRLSEIWCTGTPKSISH